MRKKKQAPPRRKVRQRKVGPVVVATLIIVLVTSLGLFLFPRSQRSSGGAVTKLIDSDTAFSVPTHVGQPAPEFTAVGVDGKPYTVMPGDGRPKAIVFYMGFQ